MGILRRRGRSLDPPASPLCQTVEACARYHGKLLAGVDSHPVIAAAHHAFMYHRPLCLSPDTIWLLICQAVAQHVSARSEELRHHFVRHERKLLIEVRRDHFIKGSPENPWSEVFHEFSLRIRSHVGEVVERFIPRFTTTGPVEQAAAEIVLLDAMQSYFEYRAGSLCGIPSITLEGTPEDWNDLADRALGFKEFGLGRWLDILSPILDQFARASRGDVQTGFWRSLYKFDHISGGALVNGWITAFFPYEKDLSSGLASRPSIVLFGEDQAVVNRMLYPDMDSEWVDPGLAPHVFPSGLSKVPFRWDYLDSSFAMEFIGGFVGVAQDQETLTLRPRSAGL